MRDFKHNGRIANLYRDVGHNLHIVVIIVEKVPATFVLLFAIGVALTTRDRIAVDQADEVESALDNHIAGESNLWDR